MRGGFFCLKTLLWNVFNFKVVIFIIDKVNKNRR